MPTDLQLGTIDAPGGALHKLFVPPTENCLVEHRGRIKELRTDTWSPELTVGFRVSEVAAVKHDGGYHHETG